MLHHGIDQLAGGTAEDYENHVKHTMDNIAEVYCAFTNADIKQCKSEIIENFDNTMTD